MALGPVIALIFLPILGIVMIGLCSKSIKSFKSETQTRMRVSKKISGIVLGVGGGLLILPMVLIIVSSLGLHISQQVYVYTSKEEVIINTPDGTITVMEVDINALWDAIEANNEKKIHKLLNANPALIYAETRYGYTPLGEAIDNDSVDVVRVLLENGADVNNSKKDSSTIDVFCQIHRYWSHNSVRDAELLNLLLEYNLDINRVEETNVEMSIMPPTHHVIDMVFEHAYVTDEEVDVFEKFLAAGPNLYEENSEGENAFEYFEKTVNNQDDFLSDERNLANIEKLRMLLDEAA